MLFRSFVVYFLIPANILIYGINDIFDYDTDKLNPKKGTYEAFIDEYIGINLNYAKIDPKILENKDFKNEIKREFSSKDRLFNKIRNYHIGKAGDFLKKQMTDMKKILDVKFIIFYIIPY